MKLEEHIRDVVKNGFEEKHLSGNLLNTLEVTENQLRIPAPSYNMYQYQMHGVIIHTGIGSYASELDENGSQFYIYIRKGGRFWITPKNHIGFVDDSIRLGIQNWALENGYQVEVEFK